MLSPLVYFEVIQTPALKISGNKKKGLRLSVCYKSNRAEMPKTAINRVGKKELTIMKKNYLVFVVAIAALLSSCANTYYYCQVYETEPVRQDVHLKNENGSLKYENAQCIVDYCFWANGGSTDFSFYNKTDEIIYVDLSKSFYVMNDVAHDLYQNREWYKSSAVGVASSASYGYGETQSRTLSAGVIDPSLWSEGAVSATASKAASHSAGFSAGKAIAQTETNAVTIREKKEVAIPPHSKKYIKSHSIVYFPMLDCDLQRYPSQSSRMEFSADNSPFRFSEIITYSVGDNSQPVTVNNEFYVSSVANYAEPAILEMRKRGEPCENMQDPDYSAPQYDIYDKVIRDNICETSTSFYNTYTITTTKKLYDKGWTKDYYYDSRNDAFVKKGVFSSKPSGNKSKNPVLGGLVIGAGVLSMAVVWIIFNIK